jgi:predicted MPP superfamily phosphohydrolase
MKNRKLKIFIRILIVLAVLGLGVYTAVKLSDNSYFVDTFYEVEDDKIENHIRIVLLTDLHLKEYGEDNVDLVHEIKRLNPDIIAMAGDMVDMDETDYSVVTSLCRQLVEVALVYFSYGNHEKEVIRVNQTSTVNVELEEMGVHVLHNKYETVEVNGNLLDIGGLSANPGTEEADYTQRFWNKYMKTENYRLLLVHYPQFFFKGGALVDSDIDMALCGHLHGGVVRIPFLGGLYHPVDGFFPEMTEGCNLVNDTWVVISRGIGGSPRFNNPPELVIIDLY